MPVQSPTLPPITLPIVSERLPTQVLFGAQIWPLASVGKFGGRFVIGLPGKRIRVDPRSVLPRGPGPRYTRFPELTRVEPAHFDSHRWTGEDKDPGHRFDFPGGARVGPAFKRDFPG